MVLNPGLLLEIFFCCLYRSLIKILQRLCRVSVILHFCGHALAKKQKACCFKFEVWRGGEREDMKHLLKDELSGCDVHSL